MSARLEVEATPGCATSGDLIARVAARSTRIQFGEAGDQAGDRAGDRAPTLRARIGPDKNGGVLGELFTEQANGRHAARRVRAATCAEAIDALALIIVVSLDPASVLAAASAGEAAPPPAAASPGARDLVRGAEPPPPFHPTAVPRPPSTPPMSPAPVPSPLVTTSDGAGREAPLPPAVRWFGFGAAAQLVAGPAPRIMPALAVRAVVGLDRPSLWSPALRLTATHARQGPAGEPGGTATFALDTLALDVCLVRLRASRFDLRACAAGAVGRLSAAGSNTYSPTSADRPYLGAGGTAVLGLALGPHLDLSAALTAADTLIRDRFEFSPAVFHRVSALTLIADLGLGLRFP